MAPGFFLSGVRLTFSHYLDQITNKPLTSIPDNFHGEVDRIKENFGDTMNNARLTLTEYESLVEQSPILIWRANTEALCDYFNDRWLSFRGRTMAQEYGNGWAEGVHPDDFERCLKIYLDNFNDRKPFEMEYRLMRHDGVYRWIFDRGVPFNDNNGIFAGFIGSCIDVTERVDAQEALRLNLESQIKQLKGIIPICSYCKKIRTDEESWQQLESYLSEHSDALFSHGMCPTCFDAQLQLIKIDPGRSILDTQEQIRKTPECLKP